LRAERRGAARPIVRGNFDQHGERAKQRKNRARGRHNPLKRLNSAKEIQGFPLIFFDRARLDSARAWPNLELAWENQIDVVPALLLDAGEDML
jgi:hypothetical protein